MRCRPSSRLLVVDSGNRILLFRFQFKDGALAGQDYWATPGGGLDEGETFEQAAIRELREETGFTVGSVGESVASREFVLQMPDGEHVLAQEPFFVVRIDDAEISDAGWTPHEQVVMTESKWWSMAELTATDATIWPGNLPAMLKGFSPDA